MIKSVFIHPSAIVDDGAHIGAGTKVWHFCHLMAGCFIGEGCQLGQNIFIDNGVEIGKGVKIQNNVSVYNKAIIEDDVFIGPSVVFTNVINPRSFINRKAEFKTTHIGKGATIGANATLICGISVGAYAFIGAGSVVTKNLKAHALVYGNPARQQGWISKNGYPLVFNEKGKAECKEEGAFYTLIADEVVQTS